MNSAVFVDALLDRWGGTPMSGTVDPVERHREALEALAECGETQLAEDAQALLDAANSED